MGIQKTALPLAKLFTLYAVVPANQLEYIHAFFLILCYNYLAAWGKRDTMNDYSTFKLNLVKDLTLEAMETGLLKAENTAETNPEESAKAVAAFFNALLQSIKG